MSTESYDDGTVYLFHLDPPYKHARHYQHSAQDRAARLAEHGTSLSVHQSGGAIVIAALAGG